MQALDEVEFVTFFRIPLDDPTVAELMELAEDCHASPISVISAIIKDTLMLRKRMREGDDLAAGLSVQ